MSKRYFQETLDDFELNSDDWTILPRKSSRFYTSKQFFIMDDSSSSSSSSSAAASESRMYNGRADYYVGKRLQLPLVLNEYAAMRKTFYPANLIDANNRYVVRGSSTNSDSVQRLELTTQTSALFAAGSTANILYGIYDEYRIRCVKYEFHNEDFRETNTKRVETFLWYIDNHQEFTDEQATTMHTYQYVRQAIKTGERVKPYGDSPDRGLAVQFVPQVQQRDDYVASSSTPEVYSDIPMPWMKTTDENKNLVLRGPMLIWRKPYTDTNDQPVAGYNVIAHACIEFRNCDQNKL